MTVLMVRLNYNADSHGAVANCYKVDRINNFINLLLFLCGCSVGCYNQNCANVGVV